MDDPREAVAETLHGLAETLRHHRDLGLRDIVLATVPFPDPADALREQEQARQGCQLCKLCKSRTNVAFGSGHARARLMVVGEGPGEEEDKQGVPFVGRAGQLLTRMLASVGFDRERDCYIANVVKCRPEPYRYRASVLVPTFHPAFLLRNPGQEFKRMAWDDLKLARREYDRLAGGGA
jgi:uracil-DNA glycosylase